MNLTEYINNLSDTQLIFGPAFIMLGFLSMFIHVSKSRKVKDSLNWPYANGIIMHSYYYSQKLSTSSDSNNSGPDIRYYFILHGKKYESSRISIFQEHSDRDLLDRFKKDDEVKVYYDPNNPKMSVLIPGGSFNFYVNLFIIILPFFFIGIGVFVFG